jgi:hypothetical protein
MQVGFGVRRPALAADPGRPAGFRPRPYSTQPLVSPAKLRVRAYAITVAARAASLRPIGHLPASHFGESYICSDAEIIWHASCNGSAQNQPFAVGRHGCSGHGETSRRTAQLQVNSK